MATNMARPPILPRWAVFAILGMWIATLLIVAGILAFYFATTGPENRPPAGNVVRGAVW